MSENLTKSKRSKPKPSAKLLIKQLLEKCQIDPTKTGPWQTIAETGGADYLEVRALEEIQRAIQCMKTAHAPGLQDFQMFEQHAVQATELLTLARLKRKTYLLDKNKEHVVIVTQLGLQEGESSQVLETRRMVATKGRGEKYVPINCTVSDDFLKRCIAAVAMAWPDADFNTYTKQGSQVIFKYKGYGIIFTEHPKSDQRSVSFADSRETKYLPLIVVAEDASRYLRETYVHLRTLDTAMEKHNGTAEDKNKK